MIVGIDTIASDDGGHRGYGRRGWGGRRVDGAGGIIYSMHETSCTVVDRVVSGHRGAGRCMYVNENDERNLLWQW
jgi:hypothetical protein